mgnify:CR=1 FL=1
MIFKLILYITLMLIGITYIIYKKKKIKSEYFQTEPEGSGIAEVTTAPTTTNTTTTTTAPTTTTTATTAASTAPTTTSQQNLMKYNELKCEYKAISENKIFNDNLGYNWSNPNHIHGCHLHDNKIYFNNTNIDNTSGNLLGLELNGESQTICKNEDDNEKSQTRIGQTCSEGYNNNYCDYGSDNPTADVALFRKLCPGVCNLCSDEISSFDKEKTNVDSSYNYKKCINNCLS